MSIPGVFSTLGDIMSTWGYLVHQRDTMSISGGYHEYVGGYHEYIKGCSVHQGIS